MTSVYQEQKHTFRYRARQHQYAVRSGEAKNCFCAHAAYHHVVDGSVEQGAETKLFRWKDAQFLDSDRHWKRRAIKESLDIHAYKAKVGGDTYSFNLFEICRRLGTYL
mmetsp:Transcript_43926/g.64340  ORF Transcript_43926/g.64340 Transcript_43926/m.64340 type:complete len:108 (-) Transcript_43926:305-628(-)